MRNLFHFVLQSAAVCCVLLLGACGFKAKSDGKSGDTIRYEHAELLTTVRYADHVEVGIKNPWRKGELLDKYYLVRREDSVSFSKTSHKDGTTIVVPITRAIVGMSPLCQLMMWLGCQDKVCGVFDANYLNIPQMSKAISDGTVYNCGSSMSPNIEQVVQARAQTAFLSAFEGSDNSKLTRTGCAVVECAEYMETSALGRAEWMKFYGMLFGREAEADALYNKVKANYTRIKTLAASAATRPTVLTERVTSGTWFCPGGKSTMANLIADANGNYVFASDTHSGSLSLSPEAVLDKAHAADVWLFIYSGERPLSKADLLSEYHGYSQIKAFKNGGVFQCNNLKTPYFNEISFRPDFLLSDLAAIFHPELFAKESKSSKEKNKNKESLSDKDALNGKKTLGDNAAITSKRSLRYYEQ